MNFSLEITGKQEKKCGKTFLVCQKKKKSANPESYVQKKIAFRDGGEVKIFSDEEKDGSLSASRLTLEE